MSGRLLRKVLKEQEQSSISDPTPESEPGSEPDSPAAAAAAPSRNPFDLLDDGDGDDNQVSSKLGFWLRKKP